MKYLDGTDISLKELVWVNEGVNIGLVSLILETNEQWEEWGLGEPGFFVCLDISGRTFTQDLFIAEEEFERDGIGLLTDAEAAEVRQLITKICEFAPEVVNDSVGVLRHKAHLGIPWIFDVGSRDTNVVQYLGVLESGEVRCLTKAQVFDGILGGPPTRSGVPVLSTNSKNES